MPNSARFVISGQVSILTIKQIVMDNIQKKYRYWEWRTIAVLFVGYALFYFVRKNLGMAIPLKISSLWVMILVMAVETAMSAELLSFL